MFIKKTFNYSSYNIKIINPKNCSTILYPKLKSITDIDLNNPLYVNTIYEEDYSIRSYDFQEKYKEVIFSITEECSLKKGFSCVYIVDPEVQLFLLAVTDLHKSNIFTYDINDKAFNITDQLLTVSYFKHIL